MAAIQIIVTHIFLLLIRLYRYFISPFLGQSCRFEPTCSMYAMQAIKQYGWFLGSVHTIRRLVRCHPWCKGGEDPLT